MSFNVFTNRAIRGLFRAVALSFLVLTAMDMTSPEACAEKLLGLPAALAHEADGGCPDKAAGPSADREAPSHDSQSPAHSGEEDCFCCCAHIITVAYFALGAQEPSRHLSAVFPPALPTGPPLAPFRPPRAV
jgi:hypothetical protein